MRYRDYNGTGKWSAEAILGRYEQYCEELGVAQPLDIRPLIATKGDWTWTYPVMERVIPGIKAGDIACATIGVEFLEEDRRFVFGAGLKSRTARALRLVSLPQALQRRLRSRIVTMLLSGNVPREFRDYVRLLRHIGFDAEWKRIDATMPRDNPYAMKYFEYLRAVHEKAPSVVKAEC